MAYKALVVLTCFLAHISPILSQSTFSPATFSYNPSSCIPGSGVTAFPKCSSLFSSLDYCAGPSIASGTQAASCYCDQNLFNLIFDCDSEDRLCLGSSDIDGTFQPGIDDWHSVCDGHITYTPTTPVLSSITQSNNEEYCTTVFSACNSASSMQGDCDSSYSGSAFFSCFCQPKILSLEYTCEYLGNTSCLLTPATFSSLAEYKYCANIVSVLGPLLNKTAPASSPATVTTILGSAAASSTITSNSAPITSTSSQAGSSATTTKKSMGVRIYTWPSLSLVFYIMLVILALAI